MPFLSTRFHTVAIGLAVVVVAGLCCEPASGEFCTPSASPGLRHEFQILAGYSPWSATLIGTAENRRFFQAGLAYSYRCWKIGEVDVRPTATILPVAIVFQPQHTVAGRPIAAHSVYGLSVLPVGFMFDVKPAARLGVYGETHGGIIASAEPVPVDAVDATGLNFVFDFGAGVRWRTADRSLFRTGYRFVHISNGGTTAFNPGLDNNVLYVSFSFLR